MLHAKSRKGFVVALLAAGLLGSAYAADIVVAPGNGTLNTAANNAAAGDRLLLQNGTYTLTGTITLSKNLTIQSQSGNAASVIIDLTGATARAFTVTGAGIVVNFNNVTFANANLGSIRGVYGSAEAAATINLNGVIARNSVVGRGTFQAISGSTLNVRNSAFRDNTTADRGAALYAGAPSTPAQGPTTLLIEGSTIENNTANPGSALGAIVYQNAGSLVMRNTTFRNNITGGTNVTGGFGQIAIAVGTTTPSGIPVSMLIENSTIEGNEHRVGEPASGAPGADGLITAAVGTADTINSVVLRNNTIRNNKLVRISDGSGIGRGIILTRDGNFSLTLTGNTIEGNLVGSGIVAPTSNLAVTITGNTFRNNTSTSVGAVDLSFANAAGENVLVSNNLFEGNRGTVGGVLINKFADSNVVSNNRFIGNIGTNAQDGGAVTINVVDAIVERNYFEGNRKTAGWGAALWVARVSIIRDNHFFANIGDGVIGQNGGAPVIENNRIQFNTAGGAFTLFNGSQEIRRNVVFGNEGGGLVAINSSVGIAENNVFAENFGFDAGGIVLHQAGSFDLVHNTIIGNTQTAGNAGGGGVRVSSDTSPSTVTLTNNLIWANVSGSAGDQLWADAGSTLSFGGNNVQNNGVDDIEGVVYPDLSVDPLVWDINNGDGHPRPGSPLIGAGIPTGTFGDLNGNVRNAAAPTIGAYEAVRGTQRIAADDWSGTVDDPTPADQGLFLRLSFTDPAGVRAPVIEYVPFTNDAGNGNYALLGFIEPGAYNLCVSVVRPTFNPASGGNPATFTFQPSSFLGTQVNAVVVSGSVITHPVLSLQNGDSDASGSVDDADLTNLILDFGGAGGNTSGFPTDFNGDGVVDDADLTIIILNFGSNGVTCP